MMTVIDIKLQRPVIPSELKDILAAVAKKIPAAGSEGVVISGRIPLWVAGALVHFFHPRPWVAIFDPRLLGGVVVMSHNPNIWIGYVVSLSFREGGEVEADVEITYP